MKNQGDSAALAVIATDYEYNTLLRTTCVATLLSGGHASNALPQLAEANVNCRLFPTDTAEQVRMALERVIADTTVHVVIRSQRPSSPSAVMSPEIMQAVTRATREVFGDIPVIPAMLSGGSLSIRRVNGPPASVWS